MKYLSRCFFKFILVYVGIVFALSIVHWDGAGIFLKSSLAEAAGPPIGLTIDNQGIRRAIEVQKRHEAQLFRIPGVVGIGTGIGANGQAKIRVFTVKAGIPDIPQKLEEIPVETKVTGMFVAYSDRPHWFPRPVPIGVSTGHPDITAGTIGCRVTDGIYVYALSNNHVYANINSAGIGDYVIQPGTYDGGIDPSPPDDNHIDVIGWLYDYETIDFSVFGSNTIDAAIARTTTDWVGNATPTEGYGTPNSIIWGDSDGNGYFDNKNNLILQYVQKYGRTTHLTHGQVKEINVTSMVCYANCSNPILAEYVWFDDQISIESVSANSFSLGGDSGSLIVTDDENKNPVGLLFAGSDTTTLANRIDLVLNRFNVSIDDSEATVPGNEICDNGTDDDSDNLTDCDDQDCLSDPACSSQTTEVCDKEGDEDEDGLADCEDPDCEAYCIANYCFKGIRDGNCNPKKEGLNCPDCSGSTQPGNEICDNGLDDDDDFLVDCDDHDDCDADPVCAGSCLPKGSICNEDGDCCSGKCPGIKCK
jgi:hypothetical protein